MAHAKSPGLFGRQRQLIALRRAVSRTAAGSGTCVVLEGPAGIGKSRLLAAATELAASEGIVTAVGRATEIDRSAPLSTLVSALQSNPVLAQGVAQLATGVGPVWLLDRLSELLESYVNAQPLVIALDDAHWADELTALALQSLVPALAHAPLMWLLARRTVPVGRPAQDTIDRLITDDCATRLTIGPLDDDAIMQLCVQLLGAPPDESLRAELARSGGNPFLVEELLCGLRESHQLSVSDGVVRLLTRRLPDTFLDAVERRLHDLSPTARRLLDAASVLGRPFSVHEAAKLVGAPPVDLIPAAVEAVRAGALVDHDVELAFRHDLIRAAVYNALSGPVRRALHREASTVVREEGRSQLEAAEHLVRSGHVADSDALAVLSEAVEEMAPTSPATAADLSLRILDLLGETAPSRGRITAKAVQLLASAGRVVEARQIGEQALRRGLAGVEATAMMLGLAEAAKHAGDNRAVVEYTRSALARPDVPESLRAQLLATQAHAMLRTENFADADDVAAEAVRLGESTGNDDAVVFATVVRSSAALSTGEIEDALSYARHAVTTADERGGESLHRHPRLWLARALVASDRLSEADAVLELSQREALRLGTAWSQPLWHYYRAELCMAWGRLDDALAEGEAGVRVAEQTNALALEAPLLGLLGHIFLYRDDITRARDYLSRAEKMLGEGISVGPEDLAWRLALIDEAEGDHRAAFECLVDVYALLPHRVQLLVSAPDAGPRLVRFAMQAGREDQAEQVVAAAQHLADRNPRVESLRAAAQHCAGVLRDDAGALMDAVETCRRSPRPLQLALALEDAACAEAAEGNRTHAVDLLEEAADISERHNDRRGAVRAAKELQALGIRRKSRRSPKPTSAWDQLTESELRVVRLVAEGLTNRQVAARLFLSPHTVDSHLRHSFVKLGVSSRVELTRHVIANHAEPPNHAKA